MVDADEDLRRCVPQHARGVVDEVVACAVDAHAKRQLELPVPGTSQGAAPSALEAAAEGRGAAVAVLDAVGASERHVVPCDAEVGAGEEARVADDAVGREPVAHARLYGAGAELDAVREVVEVGVVQRQLHRPAAPFKLEGGVGDGEGGGHGVDLEGERVQPAFSVKIIGYAQMRRRGGLGVDAELRLARGRFCGM